MDPKTANQLRAQAPWYLVALGELGQREVRGGENPRILEYFKSTTFHATEDEVPWCSAFACFCMESAGVQSPHRANARSWLSWGNDVDRQDVRIGDVAVFWRGSPTSRAGHVGFVASLTGGVVQLLGGNQGDAVSIAPQPLERLLAIRRP